MRRIVTTWLAALGLASAAAAVTPTATPTPAPTPEAAASGELRAMALAIKPAQIGLTRNAFGQDTWGMVMETDMDGGYYTLVAMGDGSTSIYFSTGGGIIGAGEHPSVQQAGMRFIRQANRHLDAATVTTTFAAPARGRTRFHFLTFDGARTYTASTDDLGEDRDALSSLFHAAHEVITAVRIASQ